MPGPFDPKFLQPVTSGGTGRDFFKPGSFIAGSGKDKLQSVLASKTGSVPILSQNDLIQAAPGLGVGDCWNLALKYVNGRLILTSSSLRVLGQDIQGNYNIGFCRIPLTTGGSEVFEVRSDQFFDDATASDSDIVGEEFGTTSGIAWGNPRPFFVYACNVTDNPVNGFRVFISPNPTLSSSPVSGNNIGYWDTPAVTPSDSNAFFWTLEDATIYTSKPCVCIGSFSMTKTNTDDWLVQTLGTSDGINKYNEDQIFTFPNGQMGASTGTKMKANGGTAPTFTTVDYGVYKLSRNGMVDYVVWQDNAAGGTAGAGAVSATLATPYMIVTAANEFWFGPARIVGNGINLYGNYISVQGTTSLSFQYQSVIVTTVNTLNNVDLSTASRRVSASIRYRAF